MHRRKRGTPKSRSECLASVADDKNSFWAQFAEVAVDHDTGEIRLRRVLGVLGVGRVLNVKTARSNRVGGTSMGIGSGRGEETIVDMRDGSFSITCRSMPTSPTSMRSFSMNLQTK